MGSIQTSIQLYDGATSVLGNIANAVSRTSQRFDDMNDQFDDAFSNGNFNNAKNGFNVINILINKIENNIDHSTTTQQAFTQQVERSSQAESEMLSKLKQVEDTINRLDDGIKQATAQQENFNNSLKAGVAAGNSMLNKIKSMITAYLGIQAVGKVLNTSDELTLTTARLDLMNDGLQTTEGLSNKIFESAERARGSYTDTAAVISRLGIMAGKAFQNNDEIIAFTELMNKNFKVGGASATEQASAMYQLSQAMASGRLQGDEYRSIIENAPLLASAIEDYMINVKKAKGTMKDWAADGLLTANIIKAAMFRSADEVERRFQTIPMTWSDIMTSIKNYALRAFQPILTRLNEIANSEKFQNFVKNLIGGLQSISIMAMNLLDIIINIVNFFSENWSIISPIIYGIATALSVYYGWLVLSTVAQGALTMAKMMAVPIYALLTSATMAETAAQWGLNSAMYACPLVWIIILIIALIAIIYVVIAVINRLAGTSISATGVIVGAFLVLASIVGNIVIGLFNGIIQLAWSIFVEPFIDIIEFVLNVMNGGFNSFGDAVANLIGQIISWFLSLGKVVTKIIDAIFGTNWTAGLSSLQDKVLQWGKNENAITLDRTAPTINKHFNYEEAWNKGYDWGSNLSESAMNLLSSGKDNDTSFDFNTNKAYDDIATTADNTGKMAESINISDEDLKYFHDLAEREAINRYTTREVKIDMKNYNNVSSDRDLDGIVNYLRDALEKDMAISAEGV